MEPGRERRILIAAAIVSGLVVSVAAIVPGRAAHVGSEALRGARDVDEPRVLEPETALTVTPLGGGAVEVSTGDGGGAGRIDGLDPESVRVAALGDDTWEIGTAEGRPATLVNRNGVRLDDGMSDRLRARALPWPAALWTLALLASGLRRRAPRMAWWLGPALQGLACAAVLAALAR